MRSAVVPAARAGARLARLAAQWTGPSGLAVAEPAQIPSVNHESACVRAARIDSRCVAAGHAWLDCDVTWIPQPTDQHREVLGELLDKVNVAANLVPDAHLAALAIEHGLTLCSTDGDFARFPDLRWHDPLQQ
jgi:predicted nucleic acid-binding protein